jgi:protocatechuate 3,4-dioxygenase alpha subunit
MYFPGEEDAVLSSIDADRRSTLVAKQEDDVVRFDVRLQGPDETVFFL